jgi:hypothetical protein
MKNSILGIVAAVLLLTGVAAQGTTINFSSLSQSGTGITTEGTSYTQQGFTFSGNSSTLAVWQASSSNLPALSASDTSLFQYFAAATTTLTDAGNAAFTLNSIDLAPLIAGGSGTFTVTFVGTHADHTTVMQTFTVSDGTPAALQLFDLSGFSNVVSVSFAQGTNSGFFAAQDTAFQFDDVVLNAAATGTPEPGSLSLLAIGAAGLVTLALKFGR